ncbi:LOW QUALITY PROTEIN: jupiter microtubule associated homolog 1a [Colossoma macropomum]|uniref:LOW QUALITY PROTEIN: jupiter microtubule associated homolog 1a n=1 Tax=Colossoma macropomum TaxID=42526 RepID=UPI0018647205|nr:LOW QUALITY PROTEIN: jupiter microtubule associated homolog 1a [Colossoma macropomum]
MTTTTTFQGMDPEAKSSSRVLRPPGGGSNISFGSDEDKPVVRKDKMASSIFAEPEDPHAHRRNNPPGGKPTGVLCGEPSAPLRRCAPPSGNQNNMLDEPSSANGDNNTMSAESTDDVESGQEQVEQAAPPGEMAVAGVPSGRRNPPGGKSSLILG